MYSIDSTPGSTLNINFEVAKPLQLRMSAAVEAEQPGVSLLNLYSLVALRARSATARMEHV